MWVDGTACFLFHKIDEWISPLGVLSNGNTGTHGLNPWYYWIYAFPLPFPLRSRCSRYIREHFFFWTGKEHKKTCGSSIETGYTWGFGAGAGSRSHSLTCGSMFPDLPVSFQISGYVPSNLAIYHRGVRRNHSGVFEWLPSVPGICHCHVIPRGIHAAQYCCRFISTCDKNEKEPYGCKTPWICANKFYTCYTDSLWSHFLLQRLLTFWFTFWFTWDKNENQIMYFLSNFIPFLTI